MSSYSTLSSGMASMYASNEGSRFDIRSQPVPPMKYNSKPFFSLSEEDREKAFNEYEDRQKAREAERNRRENMSEEERKERWNNEPVGEIIRRTHQDRGDYVTMKDFMSRPMEC